MKAGRKAIAIIVGLSILVVAAFLVLAAGAFAGPQRQSEVPDGPVLKEELAERSQPSTQLLLWLAAPAKELPADIRLQEVPDFLVAEAYHQQEETLAILGSLAAQGIVADYSRLPGPSAIRVTASYESGDYLSHLPGVARVTKATPEEEATGQRRWKESLDSLVETKLRAMAAQGLSVPLATNPSVLVNETYNYVSGYTYAGVTVTVTVRNPAGTVKGVYTTTASSYSGRYYAYFPYSSGTFTDVVASGDTVAVNAAGNTVSVTVAALDAWVDAASDVVTGTGPANTTIGIYLWHCGPCYCRSYYGSTTSDGFGRFSVPFGAQGDVWWGDGAQVDAYDVAGNATRIIRYAPSANIDFVWSYVWGYSRPRSLVSAVLKDSGGAVKSSATGTASSIDGWYSFYIGEILVGDSVEVSSSGRTFTLPVGNPTIMADTVNNVVYGTAPQGSMALAIYASGRDY